ncbi:MAG TPA: WD40 repeat domain-containing protein [Pirellulaceae bacterium]|nr:WD40 repeat domain-containing protein [Pirellulaceae bacterium]
MFKLEGHRDWIRKAEFTPDGRWLITAGNDRRVIKWNPATGTLVSVLRESSFAVSALAIEPSGRIAALGGFSGTIQLIDLNDGRVVREIPSPCPDIRALDFSADGLLLAAGGRDGQVRIWNAQDGELIAELAAHSRRIRDLDFLAGDRAVVTCGEDLMIHVSDLDNSTRSFRIDSRPAKVLTLERLDGDLLASAGSDNRIRIWDLKERREIGELTGHEGSVAALAFDGTRLYSAGYDTHLRIWRVNANFASTDATRPRISRQPGSILD